MMEAKDPEILKYVQDYRIHLIDPSKLTEEELEKFSTSLREVLGYIKYSGDKKQLHSITENNPRMRLDADAARVIRRGTNTPVESREEEEEVDMCKAIEEMMEDSRQEGIQKGIQEGKRETACALAKMGLPAEQIALAVSTDLEVVKEWLMAATV